MTLHEIPHDPESLDGPERPERVAVPVVAVAEDGLLSAQAVGPQAAGEAVHAVHICAGWGILVIGCLRGHQRQTATQKWEVGC